MNGSIVKKSAAKLVAAAAVLSASTALSGSASITPVPGYDILEYLESSGTQYIDTGVVYANDTKLTQSFCVVDFAGAQMQMGALDRIANVWHRFHWGVAGESTLRYIKWIGLANVGQTTLPAGADGWVDVSIDASDQSYTEDGHNTIAIFARNESGTFTCGKFRVGITRIWKGTDLVRLLVPARRLSDNALGLYDYCEPKFYENGGSGEFAAGPAMKYLVVAKAIPDSLQSIDSPVEAYCPLPVVKEEFTGRTLTKDVDYTVAWMNNTRFGEGTCTVSGAGNGDGAFRRYGHPSHREHAHNGCSADNGEECQHISCRHPRYSPMASFPPWGQVDDKSKILSRRWRRRKRDPIHKR